MGDTLTQKCQIELTQLKEYTASSQMNTMVPDDLRSFIWTFSFFEKGVKLSTEMFFAWSNIWCSKKQP